MKLRAVHQPRNDLSDIYRSAGIRRQDAIKLLRRVSGRVRLRYVNQRTVSEVAGRNDLPRQRQRVGVVGCQIVRHARHSAVHVSTTQALGVHLFPGSRFYQRWPTQKDRPLIAHNDRLVTHGRDVSTASSAGSHDDGDLRDAPGRQVGLVIEDAPEMISVGKHLVLQRQECAAGIHQINAGQMVFRGNLLGSEMLLDRDGIVGAAFHRGIVGHDHARHTGYATDAGDDPTGGYPVVIKLITGELTQLQKR